ncbi:hypothetical protein GW17_00046643 [Ensete ventricosum]|nr:hypothetical protein GW17_00046643 [Ensete ventricosum]
MYIKIMHTSYWQFKWSQVSKEMIERTMCPKAKAVIAHAMMDETDAAARLSFLHDPMSFPPASLEAAPTTPARMENTRK